MAKLRSLYWVHFVLTILFLLTLASDMAVLYGKNAFSILALSTKKQYSSFLKKVFIFQKICFNWKRLKFPLIVTWKHADLTSWRKELFKLSWLNWVISHSSWEASKIKTFKRNRWIIIVTDYHTWPAKLFWVCNHLAGKLEIFWYTAISLTSALQT